jgi:hypothetical protein
MRRFVTKSARIESFDEGHPEAVWAALFRKFAEGAQMRQPLLAARREYRKSPSSPEQKIASLPHNRLPCTTIA